MNSTRFIANPGWRYLYNAILLEGIIAALFAIFYGGADLLTGLHRFRVPVDFPFEQYIPLIPAFSLVYVSLYPAFWLAKCILREKVELKALAWTLALETVIAGFIFLLIPAEANFPPATNLGIWTQIYQLADEANLTYNLLPSLHVTYTFTLAFAFSRNAGPFIKKLLWIWAAAMTAATVLTHHHHIIDAFAGICFAFIMQKKIAEPYLIGKTGRLMAQIQRFELLAQRQFQWIMCRW